MSYRKSVRLLSGGTVLVIIICAIFLFQSCDIGHGVDPIRTKIQGQILFVGPPPPNHVREARVAVAKKFPPEDLTSDLIYSDPLEFKLDKKPNETDTVRFEFVTEPGEYPAAGVLWRRKGEPWDIANILGLYTPPGELTPQPVIVTEEDPITDGIDILANWDLATRDAVIEGKITFKGGKEEWPQDTEIVALAFFPIVPKSQLDFLTVKALDINVKLFTAEYNYRTAAGSGEYKFITLFWKGRTTSIFDIRSVGFYQNEDDILLPQSLCLEPGETKTGVDFVVDFSSLPVGVLFNKEAAACKP